MSAHYNEDLYGLGGGVGGSGNVMTTEYLEEDERKIIYHKVNETLE